MRINANGTKSVKMTFIIHIKTYPPVTLNGLRISAKDAKYLVLYFYRKLNWKKIYLPSESNLEFNWARCTGYSIVNHNCRLKTSCYYIILKHIWAYDIQLWNTVSNSNIEILQRFQNKIFRIIVDVPWYVTNDTLHHILHVLYIIDEIRKLSQKYADRMKEHPNIGKAYELIKTSHRLKRRFPQVLCAWPK